MDALLIIFMICASAFIVTFIYMFYERDGKLESIKKIDKESEKVDKELENASNQQIELKAEYENLKSNIAKLDAELYSARLEIMQLKKQINSTKDLAFVIVNELNKQIAYVNKKRLKTNSVAKAVQNKRE